jgi:ActR/RegA family two-component response regulator
MTAVFQLLPHLFQWQSLCLATTTGRIPVRSNTDLGKGQLRTLLSRVDNRGYDANVFAGFLLSSDQVAVRLFQRVYQDLGMELQVCPASVEALEELQRRHYEAVIVDCDVEGSGEVLRCVRSIPANRNSTAFAILNTDTSMRGAFDLGANLTMQKPLSLENVRKSLRALNMLLEQEYRRFHRVPVEFEVVIALEESKDVTATAINISSGGLALRLQEPIPASQSANVRFSLPGSTQRIEAKVIIAWADAEGKAGLRFDFMPSGARRDLEHWLAQNTELPKKQAVGASPQPREAVTRR